MQILKPDILSCTSQPLDWRGTLHQSFTIGLGFSLLSKEEDTLLPEDAAWAAAMQGLAPGMCMDSGVPKAKPEWLLAGAVRAPEGQPVVTLEADMHIGQQTRRFLVGHRHAAPWIEQPLLWTHTWGSPTHEDNPEGCGLAADPASGKCRVPLVSDADSAHAAPACPGPRGVWPCRQHAMGTYGPAWLKERWPGVPDDFDWTFFNLAQPCQWLPVGISKRLPIILEHVHPEHPRLHSHVPDKDLKVDVLRHGETEWQSAPATPDTLWLFPNQGVGIVLWHALVPCADEVGGDIAAVRLTLLPEDAQCAPPPLVPPPPPPPQGAPVPPAPPPPVPPIPPLADAASSAAAEAVVPNVAAAGVAMAAATVAAAAVVAAAGHKKEHTPTPPPKPVTRQEAPPETVTRQEVLHENVALALEDFEAHKEELNEALADLDLPPLTPEQEAEVRQRIQEGEQLLQGLHDQLDREDPTMEDMLRQAGVDEKTIAQAQAALELNPPDPMDFDQPEAWRAAVESFIAEADSVLPLNDTARLALREGLALVGPGGMEKMADMAHMPNTDPSLEDMLALCGLAPEAAEQLSNGLSTLEPPDADASSAEWAAFGAQAEAALGFAPGSMASTINGFLEARQQLEAASGNPQSTPGKPDASGTPDTPETPDAPGTPPTPPTSGRPAGATDKDTPPVPDSAPSADMPDAPPSASAIASAPAAAEPHADVHARPSGDHSSNAPEPRPPAAPEAAVPARPLRTVQPRWTAEEIAKAPPAVRAMMLRTLAEDEAAAATDNEQEPTP